MAATSARQKRRHPILWSIALALALAAFCLLYPPSFRACLRELLLADGEWRNAGIEIGEISGSLYQPITLRNVNIVSRTSGAASMNFRLLRVEITPQWWDWLLRRSPHLVRKVCVDGMRGEVNLPGGSGIANLDALAEYDQGEGDFGMLAMFVPHELELLRGYFALNQKGFETALDDIHFTVSEAAPGIIEAHRVEIRRPEFTKTFDDVRGTTAFDGSKLSLNGLKLDSTIRFGSISADLREMQAGRAYVAFDLAAFGGMIRGEALAAASGGGVQFDASGSFSQIAIEDVANFVAFSGVAGGVIKEGKFTFRGSPRDFQKATLSIRLEATDFLWGKRKWNSLVVGATLFDRQVLLPEFRLSQAHNELSLRGEMAIPEVLSDWWQSQFSFDISARVDNLSELAALFGPEFGVAAGKVNVEGSVRGQNRSYTGQLQVQGSRLSYGAAPLDALNATLNLNGNELNVSSIEFSHKGDFLRGRGVVNILGEKRYLGRNQDLRRGSRALLQLFPGANRPGSVCWRAFPRLVRRWHSQRAFGGVPSQASRP